MMEDSRMARGRARGMAVAVTYPVSSRMALNSNPLPTRSSMYFQKNCITSTNNVTKKVAMKGPMKACRMSLSSFFINGKAS